MTQEYNFPENKKFEEIAKFIGSTKNYLQDFSVKTNGVVVILSIALYLLGIILFFIQTNTYIDIVIFFVAVFCILTGTLARSSFGSTNETINKKLDSLHKNHEEWRKFDNYLKMQLFLTGDKFYTNISAVYAFLFTLGLGNLIGEASFEISKNSKGVSIFIIFTFSMLFYLINEVLGLFSSSRKRYLIRALQMKKKYEKKK